MADKVIQQEKEQQKNGYKPCILAKTHDPRFTDEEKMNMAKLHGIIFACILLILLLSIYPGITSQNFG